MYQVQKGALSMVPCYLAPPSCIKYAIAETAVTATAHLMAPYLGQPTWAGGRKTFDRSLPIYVGIIQYL